MRWTDEELKQHIAAIPEHDKGDIIFVMSWLLFGDTDDAGIARIDTERSPDRSDLKNMVDYLGRQLIMERSGLKVKEVIRCGELEIEPGHTVDEIVELANERLNEANAWDVCGQVLFLGADERYYVGNVEFVIVSANPAYVELYLNGNDADQRGDDEEETE